MIGYTWFKTPDSNCFHCVEQHKGSIKELYSFEQLASEEGFVIAPFFAYNQLSYRCFTPR